jgi:hypothetical protein
MDLGSEIRKKPIPDPGSRGQKGTGSRIRICFQPMYVTRQLGTMKERCDEKSSTSRANSKLSIRIRFSRTVL